MWCVIDKSDVGDAETSNVLENDRRWDWVHKNKNGWHTLAGTWLDRDKNGRFEATPISEHGHPALPDAAPCDEE
jgi:hypothetical protein